MNQRQYSLGCASCLGAANCGQSTPVQTYQPQPVASAPSNALVWLSIGLAVLALAKRGG